MKTTDPMVVAVDGSTILLRSTELRELAKIVPKEFHDHVKLPLIVLRRMELGRSVYTVSGERMEEFIVKKILGLTDDDYRGIYKHREQVYLYRAQVSGLLRRFHSLVVLGFSILKEFTDYLPSRD